MQLTDLKCVMPVSFLTGGHHRVLVLKRAHKQLEASPTSFVKFPTRWLDRVKHAQPTHAQSTHAQSTHAQSTHAQPGSNLSQFGNQRTELASSKKNSKPDTPQKNYELIDPDVRLMMRVRDDDASAFEELMRRYQNRLIAVLEHLVPGKNQAEDLAQEVFMRVYRARKTYKPGAKFSTWLFTIANNVSSNALRKLARSKEIHIQATPSGSFPARPLENMAQDASGLMPARVLDRSEQAEIVEAAIRTLNDRQRLAVLLNRFEHMSYIDIAETMELSTQAVKSLLSRARSNLREALLPYMQNGTSIGDAENDETMGPDILEADHD